MKKQNGLARIYIILIIIAVIVVISGAVAILKLSTTNNTTTSNIVGTNKNIKDIKYINPKKTKGNKMALLVEGEYVVTIDEDKEINFLTDFFQISDEKLEIDIKGDHLETKIYSNELTFSINMEYGIEDEEIVKKDGNWIIYKPKYSKDCYEIGYKTDLVLNSIYLVKIVTLYDSNKDEAIEKLEKIKQKVNVYKYEEDEGNYTFTDFEENQVDLSNYDFIRDIIAKSLLNYGIYLRNPANIEEVDFNHETYLCYYIKHDDALGFYHLYNITDKIDKSKIKKEFKYNGKKIFISEIKSEVCDAYIEIEKEKYIKISYSIDNLTEDNIEVYLKNIL